MVEVEAAPTLTWTLLRERPGARLVNYGPLVCVFFTGEGLSKTDELHADFDVQDELLEQWGTLSQLVIFEARRMNRVGAEARTVAGERLQHWGTRLHRSGLVVLGSGLAARMLRVAMMTAVVFSKTSGQHSIFERLGPALDWVRRSPGQHPAVEGASLADLVERFHIPAE